MAQLFSLKKLHLKKNLLKGIQKKNEKQNIHFTLFYILPIEICKAEKKGGKKRGIFIIKKKSTTVIIMGFTASNNYNF